MSARPQSSNDPSADDASIHLLVDVLLDALTTDRMSPALVHFRRDGASIETDAQPLCDLHPREYLLGYEVPQEYFAIGVAARGWAHHMDPASDVRPERVSVVSIVSRTGEQAHATATQNPDHPLNLIEEPPPAGEQIDLMRRSLGLDTPPPPCETNIYWAVEWLASIADEASLRDRDLDWPEAQALHPSARLMALGGCDPDNHDFVTMVASFGRVCGWSRIRSMVDEGGYGAVGLEPGHGAWFDDGSFARYLLARCEPLPELLDDLHYRVTKSTLRHVEDVLARVGVPDRVWPDTFAL